MISITAGALSRNKISGSRLEHAPILDKPLASWTDNEELSLAFSDAEQTRKLAFGARSQDRCGVLQRSRPSVHSTTGTLRDRISQSAPLINVGGTLYRSVHDVRQEVQTFFDHRYVSSPTQVALRAALRLFNGILAMTFGNNETNANLAGICSPQKHLSLGLWKTRPWLFTSVGAVAVRGWRL